MAVTEYIYVESTTNIGASSMITILQIRKLKLWQGLNVCLLDSKMYPFHLEG